MINYLLSKASKLISRWARSAQPVHKFEGCGFDRRRVRAFDHALDNVFHLLDEANAIKEEAMRELADFRDSVLHSRAEEEARRKWTMRLDTGDRVLTRDTLEMSLDERRAVSEAMEAVNEVLKRADFDRRPSAPPRRSLFAQLKMVAAALDLIEAEFEDVFGYLRRIDWESVSSQVAAELEARGRVDRFEHGLLVGKRLSGIRGRLIAVETLRSRLTELLEVAEEMRRKVEQISDFANRKAA